MADLHDYQDGALDACSAAFAAGAKGCLCVSPTGSGKTIIGAEMARRASRRGLRVLWLAHRIELIQQAADRLSREGLIVGPLGNVIVESIQTLFVRGTRPPADLIVWDEAHHNAARTYREVWGAYPDAFHVGLTATPCRADGAALGAFDALIRVATVRELTAAGHLAPCDVIGPAERRKCLAEDPVAAYRKHSPNGRAIVFCKTVKHAEHVAAAFNASGITARAVEGNMPSSERAAALGAFKRGDVSVVTNVHVTTEGFDAPAADTCILARGFSHEGAYLQAVGRVLRTSPGKTRALVIDLYGVSHELGLPDDDREWSLEGKAVKVAEGLEPIRQCAACGGVFRAALYRDTTCPRCGAVKPALPDPAVRRAEIGRITTTHTAERRRAVLDGLRRTARERGYREGWVAMRWKLLYGRFPTRAEMGGRE